MVRVLLCGDIRGQLRLLYDQIARLHSKLDASQHFQAVFCVGEFSASGAAFDLELAPPVPVYFIDAGPGAADLISASPQGRELRPNLNFLGHFGVAKIKGLSVAYLSGRYCADLFDPMDVLGASTSSSNDQNLGWEQMRIAERQAMTTSQNLFIGGNYTPLAVKRLKEEIEYAGSVDLLLTAEWPAKGLHGVSKEARAGIDKEVVKLCSSVAVAELAVTAEPKYHATGLLGMFWRRPPWRHERRGVIVPATGKLQCGVCRQISLGALGGVGSALSMPKASPNLGKSTLTAVASGQLAGQDRKSVV